MIEERRLPVTLKTTNASKVERPPESHWREVWQVLVEECGARPIGDGSAMCEQFIAYMNRDEGSFGWEFRFMGDLGFGGKFIRDNWRRQPYRVSCYPEDMTPARRELMDRANERLAALSSKNDTGGSL